MPDLGDIIRELAGPLRAEGRTGYRDTTIIGASIGEYARGWAGRARQAGLSEEQRARCGEISLLLSEYRELSRAAREKRVAHALRLLGELSKKAGGDGGGGQRPAYGRLPRESGRAGSGGHAPASAAASADAIPALQPQADLLDQPISAGKGRSTLAQRLAKLGLETNRDVLYHFPREYVPLKAVNDLVDGERAAVIVEVLSREQSVMREVRASQLIRFALEVADDSGRAWVVSVLRVPRRGQRQAVLLNSPPALNHAAGMRLLVEGSVKRAGRFVEIQYGDVQRLTPGESFAGAFTPVYPLTDGLYQGQVRGTVRRVLGQLPHELPDHLPPALRERCHLIGLAGALRDIHWPPSEQAKEAATRRLALEEMLTLQLAMAQRKQELQRPGTGIAMRPRVDVAAAMEEVLPFALTRAQQRAIAEIVSDMASDRPMCRLIQGDVGSGKTVVAAAALTVATQGGYQGAVMAPTELLAEQHYFVLSRLLAHFGVSVGLLTGSLRATERAQARRRIASGRAEVVVGTHALIQEGVGFRRLGLVVVDEQHRFGVRQRAELRTKGQRQPDMLVMTATPIPRTLALTVYGDLEMSVLDEMPPGRTPVQTSWIPTQRQQEAYGLVLRQVAKGRQGYVVCPLIEESENLQAEAADKLAGELQAGELSGLRLGLLHGAMKVAEKDAVMEAFRAGETDVLVSTTVVEVGVDVPNATVMLILNAERFGLAQLHQLRGRVGRGQYPSHCLLVTHQRYDPTGRIRLTGEEESLEEARQRLKVLIEQSDGFAIAEEDLLLRGPGEFYGTRQHGLPDFRLARMARDRHLVEAAREAAVWLTECDPELRHPEHAALRERVAELRARMGKMAG